MLTFFELRELSDRYTAVTQRSSLLQVTCDEHGVDPVGSYQVSAERYS